jgi:FtsP/CotA-like multicopper oxidase with cupredoxin domain
MLGHGEPIRVKKGQHALFHILNGSASKIRSLAMAGHRFGVVATDGNPVSNPVEVPVLWIGTAEPISAILEMNHPGAFALGDLSDDDRGHGMSIVMEYTGARGTPQWHLNIPDAHEIAVVDLGAGKTIATWSTKDLHANFPMALDPIPRVACERFSGAGRRTVSCVR